MAFRDVESTLKELEEAFQTPSQMLNRVRSIVEACPEVMTVENEKGSLPLHIACEHQAPLAVVRYLYKRWPSSIKVAGQEGLLPLHVACTYQAPLKVVQYLESKWPESVLARNQSHDGWLAFHLACRYQAPLEVIRYLMQRWPGSIQVKASRKRSLPLHIACEYHASLEVIKYLVDHLPEAVDSVDNDGRLPLHLACGTKEARIEVVALLVEQNPDSVKVTDRDGLLPLHFACGKQAPFAVVQYLIELWPYSVMEGDNDRSLALHIACGNQASVGVVEYLVDQWYSSLEEVNTFGLLPLHYACRNQARIEVVTFLVESSPESIKATDAYGLLPLHYACAHHASIEVVQYLVEEWPESIEVASTAGLLPVHYACATQAPLEVLVYLVEARPESVQGALHFACAKQAPVENVRYLLEQSPDSISAVDQENNLALHIASSNHASWEVLQLLVERSYGSSAIKEVNNFGMLPLHCACANQPRLEEVKFLVEQWPESIQTVDRNGFLPLHFACGRQASLEVVRYLVERRFESIREVNKHGSLPLHMACGTQAPLEVVKYLVGHWDGSVKVFNKCGLIPLHYACGNKACAEVVDYLLQQWPESSKAVDGNGLLPLHYACAYHAPLEVVKRLLVSWPESVTEVDNAGKTPLEIAKKENAHRAISLLEMAPSSEGEITSVTDSTGLSTLDSSHLEEQQQLELPSETIVSSRKKLQQVLEDIDACAAELSPEYVEYCLKHPSDDLRGDFGAVYLGVDMGLKAGHRQMTIKRICNDIKDNQTWNENTFNFLTEVKALRRCRHPNVMIPHGYGETDAEQFLVYEYASRGSLDCFLRDETGRAKLSCSVRLSIMYQISRAIHFLHSGGCRGFQVYLGDISSSNICLTDSYTAKLMVGGTIKLIPAKNSQTAGPPAPTQKPLSMAVFGALENMYSRTPNPAGESQHLSYTASCDIYAIGVVMTELIVGCLQSASRSGDFFRRYILDVEEGETVVEGPKKLQEEADPILDWNEDTLGQLCDLAAKCMQPVYKKRIVSADLVAKLFEIANHSFVTVNSLQTEDIKFRNPSKDDNKAPSKKCALCHRNIPGLLCQHNHLTCKECLEDRLILQIGKSGNDVCCSVGQCSAEAFGDQQVYHHTSVPKYKLYVRERERQMRIEDQFQELASRREKTSTLRLGTQATLRDYQSELGSIYSRLRRSLKAMSLLTTIQVKKCPPLVWMIPGEKSPGRRVREWAKPSVEKPYLVYFFCQHSLTPMELSLKIKANRNWLTLIAPALKVSLIVLKVASAAVDLPFPFDLDDNTKKALEEGFIDSLLDDSSRVVLKNAETVLTDGLINTSFDRVQSLVGSAYELLADKANNPRQSRWKERMSPVMDSEGAILWVKQEYADHY